MVMVDGRVSLRLLYQNRRIGPGVQSSSQTWTISLSVFCTLHNASRRSESQRGEGAFAARLPQSRTLARPEINDRCDVRKLQEAQEKDGLDSGFEDRLLGLNIHRPSRGCE
jgi:hypothetical protein